MSVIQGNAIESGLAAYEIPNSLKFNSADSAYMSWTPASAGNKKTFTISMWVKRSGLPSGYMRLLSGSGGNFHFRFTNSHQLSTNFQSSATNYVVTSNQVFRDVSGWYHLVAVYDTTQATSSDRIKFYVNGVQITSFAAASYPPQNAESEINAAAAHYLCSYSGSSEFFDGYVSEVNFIDGATPSTTTRVVNGVTEEILTELGEFNAGTGVWQPIAYAGTYGTNGFYLPMTQDQIVEGFNTVLWRGNGGTQKITGVGFAPSLVWSKQRSTAVGHDLEDVVRGAGNSLFSELTNAETSTGNLSSFDADGFTVTSGNRVNQSGYNYVGWCWDAGNSTVSNTDGTITSSVRASQTYGFSIITHTGTGSNGTIGHGLGVAPKFVLTKRRSAIEAWTGWHTGLSGGTYNIELNTTNPQQSSPTHYTAVPTSSVINLGTNTASNASGSTYVTYAFAETGYSKFGSYTGTGASGNTVTLGFKPAFVMIKRTDTANDWVMLDSTRDGTDSVDKVLFADLSNAEAVSTSATFTDTGFTLTSTSASRNASGGTYIYAAFKDQREAAFWRDFSGNGNHWQPNNLDFNDSVVDVPTSYGTDTGVGAEVRGNYATLNPLLYRYAAGTNTLTNGNLEITGSSKFAYSTFQTPLTGKWYFEGTVTAGTSTAGIGLSGLETASSVFTNYVSYLSTGNKDVNGTVTSYGATYTSNDVIGVAVDCDSGTITFYKNNTSQGSIATTVTDKFAFLQTGGGWAWKMNFGQLPFAYAAPTGFKALCTTNLPDPAIADGSTAFNTVLYNGNGNTGQTVTGVGFQPDFVWLKNRNQTGGYYPCLFDSVRGAGYRLRSDSTAVEADDTAIFSAFTSDGFTFPAGQGNTIENDSAGTYVSWNWKTGGTAVSNTDGTNTSAMVSANPDAGISIVTYTGTGTNSTVGHGLSPSGYSNTPAFIVTKRISGATGNWFAYHKDAQASGAYVGYLNLTDAFAASTVIWNNTQPTDTVFSLGTGNSNVSTAPYVAYCFAPIEGYSAFGSYKGNSSTDGPFVYTGFRPAFVIAKAITTGSTRDWFIFDAARNTYNVMNTWLDANTSDPEGSQSNSLIDFVSNGFKIRGDMVMINSSSYTYIYMAFAENPFKYSLAR